MDMSLPFARHLYLKSSIGAVYGYILESHLKKVMHLFGKPGAGIVFGKALAPVIVRELFVPLPLQKDGPNGHPRPWDDVARRPAAKGGPQQGLLVEGITLQEICSVISHGGSSGTAQEDKEPGWAAGTLASARRSVLSSANRRGSTGTRRAISCRAAATSLKRLAARAATR